MENPRLNTWPQTRDSVSRCHGSGFVQATEQLWPGWTDGTIAAMSNWGPIAFVAAFLPTSYLFDVHGPPGCTHRH
jgi:hypothetical protein